MESLKEKYTAYIDRYRAKGGNPLAFPCPHCKETIETLPAPKGDRWDTVATCPHCEQLYIQVATNSNAAGYVPPGS